MFWQSILFAHPNQGNLKDRLNYYDYNAKQVRHVQAHTKQSLQRETGL